jgi:hypothetical protein
MKVPKRLRGTGENGSHARAPKQEKELADRLGGKTTRGSGSGNEKGDVRVPRLIRIEAKTTKHKSFSVTLDTIRKIEDVGLSHGEIPAMVVEFNDKGKKLGEVAIVPIWALEMITRE